MIYPDVHLSPRECEVMRCICRDMTDPEIAAALFMAEGTVQAHIAHIKRKLGVKATRASYRGAYWRGLARAKTC